MHASFYPTSITNAKKYKPQPPRPDSSGIAALVLAKFDKFQKLSNYCIAAAMRTDSGPFPHDEAINLSLLIKTPDKKMMPLLHY